MEQLGVSRDEIDVGFEYNTYFTHQDRTKVLEIKDSIGNWEAPYVVAYGPVEGYEVLKRYACQAWLPFSIREILLLVRPNRSRRIP